MRWGHARRPSWFTFFLLEMGTAAWLSPFFGRNIEKGVDPHAALEDNRPVLVMHRTFPKVRALFIRGGCGAIAQLGERVNGIHEVGSSILPGSTKFGSRKMKSHSGS